MLPNLLLLALAVPAVQLDTAVGHPQPRPGTAAGGAAAAVRAVRASGPISIDGRPDEPAWSAALPIGGLTQRMPREGAAPSERTEIRVLFDDDAVYVAARLYDAAPDSVTAVLARRDRTVSADRFLVFLDPYHDHRSGFYFGINAAGTLYDGTLYNDDWNDDTWDGVWEGRAARDSLGWTAELRIPYSQLRFQRKDVYVWGVNFEREIARRNEQDYLVVRPTNGSGFVSRFVDLVGIERVSPRPRIEVMPYVTGRAEFLDHEPGDPFITGPRARPGAGLDAKVGIGGNLTLDGTVNPDFGQVEVDPAVVNLTDVETFYPEKRPFFIEGASIFNFGSGGANDFWSFNWGGGADFLYTRRIGRAPQLTLPTADFSSEPAGTHILGAAKLSGKAGTWSLGALNALTNREFADLALGPVRWRSEVEPLTWYGVYRAQKELGQGRYGVGVIGTGTARRLDDDSLRTQLSRMAFGLGVDGWITLDRAGVWVLTGWTGASRVAGTAGRMTDLQTGSVHYFQRPDAGYLRVDSGATALSGWAGRVTLNKQKGDWMFNAAAGAIDPGFEVNDLGFQTWADQVNAHVMAGRRWTRPSRLFQSAQLNLATFRTWDFGGDLTGVGYFAMGMFDLHNFSHWQWSVEYDPQSLNARRTRGGPLTVNPPGVDWSMTFTSDPRRRWIAGISLQGDEFARDRQHSWSIAPTLEWHPSSRALVQVGPRLDKLHTTAQYVDTFDDPAATATFGHRYLFAELQEMQLSASVRLNWIFNPRLSLEIYAQPLLSSGRYRNYKELARPSSYEFLATGPARTAPGDTTRLVVTPATAGLTQLEFDNPDFSLASLRGNAVLRWEYRPGSTIFLVWTQNRSDTITDGEFRVGSGLERLFSAAANNVFLVKVSYWWRP
ncbi:MAG TPA: DUF5916 domain-containing protein [Gemmatimonadales bacterium]|nr:DUF5916 domain-containing protein [Gemmatimonadales bacterium]